MKHLIDSLNAHPKYIAWGGSFLGWFGFDNLTQAKDTAQLIAAWVAILVSFCALILTAPKAVEEVRRWGRAFTSWLGR
jgi:hypothetical protein